MAAPPPRERLHVIARADDDTRSAGCAEVGCPSLERGWRTFVNVNTPLGRAQARYIEHESGRRYTRDERDGRIVYTFPAGQRCFADHRVPVGRPPLYLVANRQGDRRRLVRQHDEPEHWVEDSAEHLDLLRPAVEARKG